MTKLILILLLLSMCGCSSMWKSHTTMGIELCRANAKANILIKEDGEETFSGDCEAVRTKKEK
jgi:hypothetical protein